MSVGILYCVATPIGNLEDISQRAQRILGEVDKIYAEDTRVTRHLLTHFGISKPLSSLHDHNETQQIAQVQADLDQGLKLALVSDAGTPLISDPGYKLIHALGNQNYKIIPIPGASALITALSVAGLPTDRFTFEGFLPAKGSSRRELLKSLSHETRTLVFYESSHRIADSLEDMQTVWGAERNIVILRELTKLYESIYRGTVAELRERLEVDSDMRRGEFVVVVEGASPQSDEQTTALNSQQVLTILLEELPIKQAAALAARLTGLPKNQLYKQALTLQQTP